MAMNSACARGDMSMLRGWVGQGVRVVYPEPLCYATTHEKVDVMHILVKELGADVNQEHDGLITPLLIAVLGDQLDMMRILVKELGADVNLANADGRTPTFAAAENGNLAALRYLVQELGADICLALFDINLDARPCL